MNSETDNEKSSAKIQQSDASASEQNSAGRNLSNEAFDSMTRQSGALQAAEKVASGAVLGSLEIVMGDRKDLNTKRNDLGKEKDTPRPADIDRKPGANAHGNSSDEHTVTGDRVSQGTDTPPASAPDSAQKKPWGIEDFQKEQEAARERAREQNIEDAANSIINNGQLPENFDDMLREFQSRPNFFGGAQGDAQGLKDFINKINERLKAAGSDHRLDVSSMVNGGASSSGGNGDAPGTPFGPGTMYSRWTENHVNLRDRNGKSLGHAVVTTNVIPRPDVRF